MTLAIVFISCAFMVLFAKKIAEGCLASFFLILIEYISHQFSANNFVYYNELLLIYCSISLIFYYVARKYSFYSKLAYLPFALSYWVLSLFDTFYEYSVILNQDFLNRNYSFLMYGCIVFMVFLVTHGRINIQTRGSALFMR